MRNSNDFDNTVSVFAKLLMTDYNQLTFEIVLQHFHELSFRIKLSD